MKKYYLVILFLFSFCFLKSQQVYYKAVIINQCTQTIDTSLAIVISNASGFWSLYEKNSTYIELPDTGKYQVFLHYLYQDPYWINITKHGLTIDTFYTDKIRFGWYLTNPPSSEYIYCDSLCNGKLIDYYFNGNIKKIGTFKNGQPIDTLKEYYQNGKLKKIYFPYKQTYEFANTKYPKYLLIEFDTLENILVFKDIKKGIEKKYRTDKSLISEYYFKNNRNKYSEYYENGKCKIKINRNSKYQYYTNGTLWIRYKKHVSFFNKLIDIFYNFKFYKSKQDLYIFKFHEYDSTGELIKSGKFFSSEFSDYLLHGFPENIENVPLDDYKEIIYESKPKTKEVFQYKSIYNNGEYKGYKKIITKMEYRNNKWIIISEKGLYE